MRQSLLGEFETRDGDAFAITIVNDPERQPTRYLRLTGDACRAALVVELNDLYADRPWAGNALRVRVEDEKMVFGLYVTPEALAHLRQLVGIQLVGVPEVATPKPALRPTPLAG